MSDSSSIICPESNVPLADRIFSEFISMSSIFHLKLYAALGTALGFHRDHNYIHSDNDIDVFCDLLPESLFSFLNQLSVSGFLINTIPGSLKNWNYHLFKSGILIDLWIKCPLGLLPFYSGNSFFKIRKLSILSPANIYNYLSLIYSDYSIPSALKADCLNNSYL